MPSYIYEVVYIYVLFIVVLTSCLACWASDIPASMRRRKGQPAHGVIFPILHHAQVPSQHIRAVDS